MAKIEWDDSLSVGVRLIDEQHKMLIQKLRDLSDAFEMGRELNKIMQTEIYKNPHQYNRDHMTQDHSYSGKDFFLLFINQPD